nr:T9SS type A sorting domain-containing protein [Bacteroidota bacterium]
MVERIHLLIILLILICPFSKSQTRSHGIDDFKQIQQAFYLNYTGSGEDTSEGGNFRQFKRWELFWGPRLMPYNSFDTAFKRHNAFVEKFDRIDYFNQKVKSNWEELGPAVNGQGGVGRIDAIAFHPTDTNVMYVGCPSGGVWASYNRGQNWQNLNTDQQLPAIGISTIAVDPVHPNNIFLGTGDVDSEWVFSSGIYRSINGGQSWEEAGLNNLTTPFTIGKVLLHPTNEDVAFAATSMGIYKSTNRNSPTPDWVKVYPAGTSNYEYIRNVAFHPDNSGTLYATGIDVISSNQNGEINTWWRIATAKNGLDFENTPWPNAFNGEEHVTNLNMAIAPQGDYMYVNCVSRDHPPPYSWQSLTHYHVFKYDIANDLWEAIITNGLTGSGSGITQGRTEMAVSPLDSRLVFCGGVRLKVFDPDTPDKPWEKVDYNSHVDFHELLFSPWEPNVLYAGTDGGLYKKNLTVGPHFIRKDSGDDGLFYKKGSTHIINGYPTIELNNGLGISTIYNFGSSRLDPYQILTGCQDCGINYLKNDIWRSPERSSDGFQCLMDDVDIDLMYATIYHPTNGSIFRSSNNCLDPMWPNIVMSGQSPVGETSWFGASLVADPSNSKTLFQARINLWKVDDASTAALSDWYRITDVDLLTSSLWGIGNCVVYALEIAPNDPDYIYFTGVKIDSWATDFDATRVFKTTVGGGTNAGDWTDITPPTPGNSLGTYFITDIAVSSWDPDKIWITYSGYLGDYKVKHYDGFTWTDFNEGLPNIPANCIIYSNGSNDALFVGTDVGVYYREATMMQWEPFMTNLPNVKVSWLELNYNNHKLRAGTFGRGLWETGIPSCDKKTEPLFVSSNLTDQLHITDTAEIRSLKEYNESIRRIPIKVWPNPVHEGEIRFGLENADHLSPPSIPPNGGKGSTLEIYDLLGEKVYEAQIYRQQGETRVLTSSWLPGMYVAIIYRNGGAVGRCRFIVE